MNSEMKSRLTGFCFLIVIAIFFLPFAGLAAETVPRPQGFCGSCHILTYPAIINKAYETWKKGKHNKVGCIECHYKPLQAGRLETEGPETLLKSDHIPVPMVPPGHFSYIPLGGGTMKTTPQIADASCLTAACHGKADDTFRTKKIAFTEKTVFIHESHLDEKKQIEGMRVNCTTCHQHETEGKHFQVSAAICHLCHSANTKFNEGRAKCEQCHQLPTKPIQASIGPDEKPITHQMLKASGVSCSSCHFDLIQGSAEIKVTPVIEGGVIKTVLSLGAGPIKVENCRVCHDQADYLRKTIDKKEMHSRHVTVKNARCFDCHRPIKHTVEKKHQPMQGDCGSCHIEPHRAQTILVTGAERSGIPPIPDPMYKARTNCLACHVEKEVNPRGQTVMMASARTCVQCHTKDYEKMLGLWKRELGREVEKAVELENEALKAFEQHKGELTQEKRLEAGRMLKEGRENLGIVRFGNGVHNAKYAVALLDSAISLFKDTIGYLEGKDLSEGAFREE